MSSYSTSMTTSADNRVQLDSTGGGKFVAPNAISSDPGSLIASAGDYGNVNLSGASFKMGMSGQEVASLLNQQGSLAAQNLQAVSDYGSAAIAAVTENKATELATASGEPTWSKYMPLLIGGGLVLLLWRRSRK
jgi:hypothetical protein